MQHSKGMRWNCCGGGEAVFGASAAAASDYAVKNQVGVTDNESCENLCFAGNL
jgi:hypothetical protein